MESSVETTLLRTNWREKKPVKCCQMLLVGKNTVANFDCIKRSVNQEYLNDLSQAKKKTLDKDQGHKTKVKSKIFKSRQNKKFEILIETRREMMKL